MTNRPARRASNRAMGTARTLLASGLGRGAAALAAALLLAAEPAGAGSQPPEAGGGEAPAEAAGACAEPLARKVQGRYEKISDLRARFRQESFSVAYGEAGSGSEGRGRVVFAKPGRMRWVYEAPQPSVVVSDGETLWIHDPVAEEVQVMDVGEGFLSGTAIQFLLGEGDLLGAFDVRAEGCGEPRVRLVLTPRQDATYERLDLVVDPETGLVEATTVHDLFGNRTRVAFEDLELDTDPDPSQFRFEAPEGTRVLEIE